MTLPHIIGGTIQAQPLNDNFAHLNDRLKNWKASVDTFDDLPMQGNEQGDVRMVTDSRALYIWDDGWREMEFDIGWGEPVDTFDDLPSSGNTDGEGRFVMDERKIYFWDGSEWRLLNVEASDVSYNGSNVNQALDQLQSAENINYNSGVSGFDPETVKAALDLLAGSRIEDIGENENGKYVKWANGWMECTHIANLGNAVANGSGEYSDPYRTPAMTWVFPEPFVEIPAITLTGRIDDTLATRRGHTMVFRDIDENQITFVQAFMISTNSNDRDVECHFKASGRWK